MSQRKSRLNNRARTYAANQDPNHANKSEKEDDHHLTLNAYLEAHGRSPDHPYLVPKDIWAEWLNEKKEKVTVRKRVKEVDNTKNWKAMERNNFSKEDLK